MFVGFFQNGQTNQQTPPWRNPYKQEQQGDFVLLLLPEGGLLLLLPLCRPCGGDLLL